LDIFYELKPKLLARSALALGFFDGVHRGHQSVIKSAVDAARAAGSPAGLVTFAEHPRSLTLGKSPPLLTLLPQRLELYASLGIDATLVLTFSEEICRLSPRQYVETVLVGALGAHSVSVGFNHHFGRNREGNPELLRQLGAELGFGVNVVEPVSVEGVEVSSSRVREALAEGEVELAEMLLGRPYALRSEVISGDGRGRGLGFPTANMNLTGKQILPAPGVYAGMAGLADRLFRPCVINLGRRPTISAGQELSAEAHIFDFEGQLYGQEISLEFWSRLRAEAKFGSLEELKAQINKDCQAARALLPGPSARHQQALNA
jgi:riboflavin kinase/FMN adenylyltransferase